MFSYRTDVCPRRLGAPAEEFRSLLGTHTRRNRFYVYAIKKFFNLYEKNVDSVTMFLRSVSEFTKELVNINLEEKNAWSRVFFPSGAFKCTHQICSVSQPHRLVIKVIFYIIYMGERKFINRVNAKEKERIAIGCNNGKIRAKGIFSPPLRCESRQRTALKGRSSFPFTRILFIYFISQKKRLISSLHLR